MGRAQVVQAEAAGIEPEVCMNPILLKPTSDQGSQVIVHGKVWATMTAREYYQCKSRLIPYIMEDYRKLAQAYDVIVLEGAGSPAEINLKSADIVNMGMAKLSRSPVLLVGDIDRGGVFASLYGTVALLEEEERRFLKGTIINKFRGDKRLLLPGLKQLEHLTALPVLGVVPYLPLDIEEEDSLAERLKTNQTGGRVVIAIVRFPRLSNFTDFHALERNPDVSVRYLSSCDELGEPDCIILPGTKSTVADLLWMRQNGLEAAIKKRSAAGTPVIGICGGYQMLGQALHDPYGSEGGGTTRGMGLLPVETVFQGEKTRTRVGGTVVQENQSIFASLSRMPVSGYEIHMGKTKRLKNSRGWIEIQEEGQKNPRTDGAFDALHAVFGTYLHGLFDSDGFAQAFTDALLHRKGYTPMRGNMPTVREYKEAQYNALAAALRDSLRMEDIYRIIEEGVED